MRKRSISFVLCITILLSLIAEIIPAAKAKEKEAYILHNEERITELSFYETEKETLNVQAVGVSVQGYQWQLLIDAENSIWVNIYDRTGSSCDISYALVKNVLDGSGSTYIRCAVKTDVDTVYSEPICLTPLFANKESVQTVADVQPVLLEDGYVEENLVTEELAESASTFGLLKAVAPEYVTITIKYLDSSSLDGDEAAIYSPYTATIEKGSDFKQNIVSPTFLGFSPYYDKDGSGLVDDDASTIPVELTDVAENVVIYVYYKPIKVDFAIRYFFQNINDDLYSENLSCYHTGKAETGTIISDEYISTYAGDTTGFEQMYHIPENVAADGSTVFEVYYDRNYYLIQFDLNGGYGIEPVYARYGTPFIVNEPIREGYIFKGWDINNDGVKDTLPSTIPAENQKYKAIWEKTYTTYTMVFWKEKADSDTFEYWGQIEVDAESASIVSAEDRVSEVENITDEVYFTYNKFLSDANVVVEGDGSTVVNAYYNRNYYTVYFYAYGKCGLEVGHTHTDECYDLICVDDSHVHTDECNRSICAEEQHEHTEACKRVICKEPVGHTHSNTCKSNSTNNVVYALRAKYDQTIAYEWPTYNMLLTMDNLYKNSNGQVANSSRTKFYAWRKNGTGTNYISKRPILTAVLCTTTGNGITTMKANYQSASTLNISYYFESFDTTSPAGEGRRKYNGVYYDIDSMYTETLSSSTLSHKEITGMVEAGTQSETISGQKYQYLYYKRQTAGDFSFHNVSQITKSVSGLKYGQPLSAYQYVDDGNGGLIEYVPPYPEEYEENAYRFVGWYTTPECFEGSEVEWESLTMPLSNLTLYAKWVPMVHTVNFFTTLDDMKSYENQVASGQTPTVELHASYTNIEHGKVVGSVSSPDDMSDNNLDLVFAGWFYIDSGEKKAFAPLDMPINRDINVFADWSSNQPQPFRIRYLLKNDPTIKVTDDSIGFAYGGSTRTFVAKAGSPYNQLYDEYNTGYFPTIGSHSITMQYEEDKENPSLNVYDFYYVEARNIEYTVRYINVQTNKVIAEEIHTTSDAVVTERFKAFENLVPDSFYKRLVISVEWDEEKQSYVGTDDNVITFYYTPNTTSAYYAVHFMLEKRHDPSLTDAEIKALQEDYSIDGSGGYESTGTHLEGVGDVDSVASIIPQEFSGFELIDNENVAIMLANGKESVSEYKDDHYEITITKEGTELYIFYRRLKYNYNVHYYHYNTTTPVSETDFPTKTDIAIYGEVVTEEAPIIPGYTCVSSSTRQSITIRDKEEQNVIVFYYSPVQYVVEYVATPDESGWLSKTIEVTAGTETFSGSVPTPNENYQFEGWYLDEACTISAADHGTIDSQTGQFVPDKDKVSEINRNIYYAHFIPKAGDLTITRENANADGQVFVYEVKNTSTGESIYVTVVGENSVTIHDLLFGEYIVTQQNDWSWRYSDDGQTVSHQSTDGTSVVFEKTTDTDQWLNGCSELIKNQRRKTQ